MEVQTIIHCPACKERNLVCPEVKIHSLIRPSTTMIFSEFGDDDGSEKHYCIECEPTVVDCECGAAIIVRSTLSLETTLQTIAAEIDGKGDEK